MKNIIAAFFALIMCISIVSCNSTKNGNEHEHEFMKQNNSYVCRLCGFVCTHNYEEVDGKQICNVCGAEKVILTAQNITDYLKFTIDYEYGEEKYFGTSVLDDGRVYGTKIIVNVSPMQNVTFNNLKITYKLVTESWGWDDLDDKTITIPYNGITTDSVTIDSRRMIIYFLERYPTFDIVVTGVEGQLADN